jgi:tRNA threonylcarbamoyladenosine biosynthesis protein TsaE
MSDLGGGATDADHPVQDAFSHPAAFPSNQVHTTTDAAATRALAVQLAAALQAGQVIALRGDLGAGKTTFVQGLAAGLGYAGPVTSPTFILVNEYPLPGRRRLVHIDAYRLGDAGAATLEEAATFGLDEILAADDAIVAIEWSERIAAAMPDDFLLVELDATGPDERRISISASGRQSEAALAQLDVGEAAP